MLFSDWYEIMLNEVTFVRFRGTIAPLPGSAPAPITCLLSSLCNCTVCTCQELALGKAPLLLTTPNSLLHSQRSTGLFACKIADTFFVVLYLSS